VTRDQKTRSTTAHRIGLIAVAAAVIGGVTAFATSTPTRSSEASASPTTTTVVQIVEEAADAEIDRMKALAEAADAARLEAYFEAVARAEAERLEAFYAAVAQAEAERAAAEQAAAERAAAEQAAAEQAAAEQATARRSSNSGGGSMGGGWAALRNCESSGNYSAVSASGTYRGAYQFARSTWDSVARSNYPHLVGVDPASASPADQDAMALALYRSSGSSPWPHCGRHL
jgi:type IV secretory pathway VirB10-like protein